MSFFTPPERITAEVFAELPKKFRRTKVSAERLAAGRPAPHGGCFLEGPSFDRKGHLYVTDIPFGRIFRISPKGTWELIVEYDGEPNGLKIHKDGRIFVTDHKRGLMLLDAKRGRIETIVSRFNLETFKGVNDLIFASNGDLYFTDQGQTGLQDLSGAVYRLRANGKLERVAHCIASPNGIVLNKAENTLFVAATRANAVLRLPLLPDGTVSRVGVFIQMSGGRGPDGMAIDVNDGLAVAHPDMGAVWVFNARGEPLFRIDSPGTDVVTNCAFGSTDPHTLYIVDSEGGAILTAELPTAGRKLYSHS